jgi:signal transduction histidine kinase/DNA-binding response OmpR family regulator
MKLNYRFILIAFIIITIISVASIFLFYSLAGKALQQQQIKSISFSANDFSLHLQSKLNQIDNEFGSTVPSIEHFNKLNIDSTSMDYCFTLINDSVFNTNEFKIKSRSSLNIRSSSFRQFFFDNPNVILRYAQFPNKKTVYYGIQITSKFLDDAAEKVRAQTALIIDEIPVEISHKDKNEIYSLHLENSAKELKYKNNYDVYTLELENADFIGAIFKPKYILTPGAKLEFIIYDVLQESFDFRAKLRIVMLLLVIAGSAITFIIIWVSTAKFRKQFSLLSETAEIASKGNFDQRVPILTKDEVGRFSLTFNKMLDELVRNKNLEKEYSEFITLINQNPTLAEISDATLSKIIKSTGLTFGALYLVEEKALRLISSFGISKKAIEFTQDISLYTNVVEKKEKIEFHFTENFPEIKTGIASIKIKYLMIYPIVYNKETIALLEIASESKPQTNVFSYIQNIHEQLAIGLINAKSFEQLENFVGELKKLNEEYQKQNEQIINQNEELKKLHNELSSKAEELELQRLKAVELTQVKSEFLASMSHELRTPLISILGLTELLIKDTSVEPRKKDKLNIVYRNGKKLLSLITNILEFSKFESGKIEIRKESFLLSDLLEEVYNNINHLASQKDLRLVFDVQENEDVLISSDKAKLEQILLNLLFNAIKFTDRGTVTLGVRLINNTDIEFVVSDTGIGISDDDKKKIFKEFRQADGSSTRKYGGTGLGLAISKKYVELLGSKLNLKSEIGVGSKFSFMLTEIVLDLIEVPKHQFLTLTETEPEKSKSVLLITNNFDSQKLIGDYLSSYNIKIIVIDNPEEGFSLAKNKVPDAIILNPLIAGLKTWQLILELKRAVSTKEIAIILTIFILEDKIGWEPTIFDFVTDPLTTGDFKQIIYKAEKFYSKKVNRILLVDKNKNEFELLNKSLKDNYHLSSLNLPEEIVDVVIKDKPDLIVIDLISFIDFAFNCIYKLSQDRLTKTIPIVLKVSQEISEEQVQYLNNSLKEITSKAKSHPLDILKVLRDHLQIDEEETNKKINLIENSIEQKSKVFLNDKTVKDSEIKPTVMIVDDDDDALFTIGEFIKEMNCNTIYAHNGMECLLTLNHVRPDLILLDIMMPQMDGFETIKRIKNETRLQKIPIVALTAYAMLDNKEIVEKSGFNDLITKPINSQVLASKLNIYLTSKHTYKQ